MFLKKKPRSIYSAIILFLFRVIILYALLYWIWSYCIPTYLQMIMGLANKELQIVGVGNITRFGTSVDEPNGIGVYHQKAAQMQAVLFDIKIETIHSSIPMLFSLIIATTISIQRKLKASFFGFIIVLFIDSFECILFMTWAYTFLPEHHIYTPYSDSALRDGIVNFFYYFYASIGSSVSIPIIWVLLCLRKGDFQRFFPKGIRDTHPR